MSRLVRSRSEALWSWKAIGICLRQPLKYLKTTGVSDKHKKEFLGDLNTIFGSYEIPIDKIQDSDIIYKSRNELYPIKNYLDNGGPCAIATTAYTIEASYVDKLYNIVMNVFHEQLFEGYGHADEQVMTYCYDKHPEIFNLYYGDYYSIFTNYHKSNQDQGTIFYCFIQNALRCNRKDLAIDAAKSMLDADHVEDSLKHMLLEIVKN